MSGDVPLLPVYAFMAWTGQQVLSKDDGVPLPLKTCLNLLKPNDIYICRTSALTSRR